MRILRRPWQFRQVYRDGRKIECESAVLFYRPCDEGAGPLFGFVASKRIGNAVQRNRAKRLLREAIRTQAKQLQRRDVWLVAVARSGILNMTSRDLAAEIRDKLQAEGLLPRAS